MNFADLLGKMHKMFSEMKSLKRRVNSANVAKALEPEIKIPNISLFNKPKALFGNKG